MYKTAQINISSATKLQLEFTPILGNGIWHDDMYFAIYVCI